MRLAQTISIKLGGRSFMLRPTLRAAVVLERAHGLENLASKIIDLNITAVSDIIAVTAYGPIDADEVVALLLPGGLSHNLMALVQDLLDLLEGLAGMDTDAEPDDDPDDASDSEPTSVEDAQKALYRIATGKLGWPPGRRLGSDPLEILEAWKGRIELLKDIFGGDDESSAKSKGSLDDQFAALIQYNQSVASTFGQPD